ALRPKQSRAAPAERRDRALARVVAETKDATGIRVTRNYRDVPDNNLCDAVAMAFNFALDELAPVRTVKCLDGQTIEKAYAKYGDEF
ncbi:MAG: hypothetical protein AAF386_05905, partial [Pseudomonadota bacterium]